jgi:adhesin transport system outer membrane protein
MSGLLPRVDLEVSDFKVVNAGGDTGLQHDQRIMVVANWSLYEGGRSLKLHAEKTARKDELFFRLDDTRRRLVQTLSGQYATLASLRDRLYSGYSEFDALKAALAAVSERMLSGNQSLLDLLDVYERAYQVRVRLVNLHAQEFGAAAQVIRNLYGSSNDSGTAGFRSPAAAEPAGSKGIRTGSGG